MLTGLAAETTGVHANGRCRAIPAGYTILERAQDGLGGPDAIRTVMVTGKPAHVGGRTADEIKALLARQEGRARAGWAAKRQARDATLDAGPLHGEPFALTRDGLDVDGDGVLTLEEVSRPGAFRRMDADEDGQVTRQEARA
jgi:hypothetical protein